MKSKLIWQDIFNALNRCGVSATLVNADMIRVLHFKYPSMVLDDIIIYFTKLTNETI